MSIGHRTCDWWTAYGQRSQGNPLAKGFFEAVFYTMLMVSVLLWKVFLIFGSCNYNLDFQLRNHQLVYMGSTRCWPFVFAPTCLSWPNVDGLPSDGSAQVDVENYPGLPRENGGEMSESLS